MVTRRAFVGFSTPIGYDYGHPASPTRNDVVSSPNPILYGSTGLFVLYDEIWFACESLCPQNMRSLSYVSFLDVMRPEIDSLRYSIEDTLRLEHTEKPLNLADMFAGGYNRVRDYAAPTDRLDNHTHELAVFDLKISASQFSKNVVLDFALIEAAHDLDLSPILNPLTVQYIAPADWGYRAAQGEEALRCLDVATGVLTLRHLRDLVTIEGPYHPVLEELRSNIYLKDFRLWLEDEKDSWHNREAKEIVSDVNNEIKRFNDNTLRDAVAPQGVRDLVVEMATSSVLDLLPPAATIHKGIKIFRDNREKSENRWRAYCAQAKFSLLTEMQFSSTVE